MTPDYKSLKRAEDYSVEMISLAKERGLTLFEISMALQSIENASQREHGEAWDISWRLAKRVWSGARDLAYNSTKA